VSALVFLDTETTGLDPTVDQVWEFAAIRREEDGSETAHHCYVEHAEWRRDRLPESFRADLLARYDRKTALTQGAFIDLLCHVLRDKPRIVGAAPWFDAGFLAEYIDPCWSHRLIDVETLAAGKVGRLMNGLADAAQTFGIENPAAHTALGDAETTMRVYDAVMDGPR
jgi:DNA polymerase III epsilon subunit-like protein